MQNFRSLAAAAVEQEVLQTGTPDTGAALEPQELDESLLAQISGGAKAPGNGW